MITSFDICIASFNIRNGIAWDGADSWLLRRGATTQSIARLDTDVAGLQEVYGFQQRYLLRHLAGYAAAGRGRGGGLITGRLLGGEGCPVVYRSARLRLERQLTRWFSDTPDEVGSRSWGDPLPRIVTFAWFTEIATGRRFGFASLHLDEASRESRARSVTALLEWLEPGLPWIIVGDFNAVAGEIPIQRMLDEGFRDVLTEQAGGAAPAGPRLDYIFVSGEWEIQSGQIAPPAPSRRRPSDHLPLVADLHLA